jgi:short-chain fatty acids transporter
MISVSTPATLPLTTMASAAFVNIFVPSAGGQWAVQGPILVEAARALDVPMGRIIMAFAYGDQLTNMIQPFWAIPLLGITALEPKDLLGYTAIAMVVGFAIFGLGIGVLPMLLG